MALFVRFCTRSLCEEYLFLLFGMLSLGLPPVCLCPLHLENRIIFLPSSLEKLPRVLITPGDLPKIPSYNDLPSASTVIPPADTNVGSHDDILDFLLDQHLEVDDFGGRVLVPLYSIIHDSGISGATIFHLKVWRYDLF